MPEQQRSCSDRNCDKESCSGCEKAQRIFEEANPYSSIKKVIAVVSGKGGVGKSFVTASLSVLLNRKGYSVGILDADITGPSIPKMFGLNKKAEAGEIGILPEKTGGGIRVMSVNLLLERDDTPVIWRGPLLGSTVKQFWTDVVWGELDVLFIDMPPGTGDVPLTVFQSLPVDGIVIVTSPQELVSMIVRKAYNMALQMHIPVLGVVENMSHILCPDCGKKINLFGESRLEESACELGIEILGRVPIDPKIASLADRGAIERLDSNALCSAAEKLELLFPGEE